MRARAAAVVHPGIRWPLPIEDERELRKYSPRRWRPRRHDGAAGRQAAGRCQPTRTSGPPLSISACPGWHARRVARRWRRATAAAVRRDRGGGKALAPVPLVPTVTALDVAVRVGAEAVAERIAAGARAAFAVPLRDHGWVTDGRRASRVGRYTGHRRGPGRCRGPVRRAVAGAGAARPARPTRCSW